MKLKTRKGFSIIEIVLVVAVSAILARLVFTSLFSRRSRTDLDNTTRQVAALLRDAQNRSVNQELGTIWGIRMANATNTAPFYALFKTSYSSQNTISYYRLPNDVRYATSSVSSGQTLDVTFSQIAGLPSTSTTIVLELVPAGNGAATASSAVTVNARGLVGF